MQDLFRRKVAEPRAFAAEGLESFAGTFTGTYSICRVCRQQRAV